MSSKAQHALSGSLERGTSAGRSQQCGMCLPPHPLSQLPAEGLPGGKCSCQAAWATQVPAAVQTLTLITVSSQNVCASEKSKICCNLLAQCRERCALKRSPNSHSYNMLVKSSKQSHSASPAHATAVQCACAAAIAACQRCCRTRASAAIAST